MNYIVNPSIFYWMSVLDAIDGVSIVFMTLSTAGVIVLTACFSCDHDWWDEDDKKLFQKWKRIVITVFVVSILFVVFIPSKETMVEMLVAKFATVENANWTLENVKSAVDYIVEAMKTLK